MGCLRLMLLVQYHVFDGRKLVSGTINTTKITLDIDRYLMYISSIFLSTCLNISGIHYLVTSFGRTSRPSKHTNLID